MKLLSWNVNGIRAVQKKGFSEFLKKENPDILGLQEIKISDKARLKSQFDFINYEEFWNPAQREGYSGTAILVRKNIFKKLGQTWTWDNEGRVQVLDFNKFYFVNSYFPNANHELSRLNFKMEFNNEFLKFSKNLEKKKPLIICGDFNVAHEEIDIARPKDNEGNAGFTIEERSWASKFVSNGFVDIFRYFNKNKIQYTWWTYRFNARERNIGWRIDYFFVSKSIIKNVKKSFILDKVIGSDHCPIGIEIK